MTQPRLDDLLEEVLEIAQEVLHQKVGPKDNFFEHQGDSLKAIDFCERIEERLNLLVDLEVIWDAPDFEGIVRRLVDDVSDQGSNEGGEI